MIKLHSYVYHEFGAYCRETSDTIIFNFTLPTKQSSKHVSLGLFDSLLDESFGSLFPFIKHFLHSCFKAGFSGLDGVILVQSRPNNNHNRDGFVKRPFTCNTAVH